MVPGKRQLLLTCGLALALVAVASGGVLYGETASVKLSIPPQRLQAKVGLILGQREGQLHVQRIQASFTASQEGTASTVQISATNASGEVLFTCSPCQNVPLTIPQGTLVSTNKSLGFTTVADTTITTITNAVGSGSASVRATAAGTEWNTDPNTVTTIPSSPDPNLHVTNPASITGGANARSAQVIQQSDFDSVRGSLTTTVSDHMDAELTAPAPGLAYIPDPQPVLRVTSDHGVGDETPTFAITMTGTLSAVAFSESEAQALERAAVMAQVPPDQELTSDPIQWTYFGQQATGNGDQILILTGVGCMVPKLSQRTLRSQIAGQSSAQAGKSLQRTAPGSTVEIQTWPSAMPWLPLVAEHISIKSVVEPGLDPVYTLSGTVPAGATTANVGVRVNEEGAGPGKADFIIDGVAYRQNGEWLNRVPNPDFALNLKGWGLALSGATLQRPTRGCAGSGLHFTATSDQSIQLNSPEFKVAAGAPFTVTFASRIAPVSNGSEYFAVFFLGPGSSPNEREVQRERIQFTAPPAS